MDWTELASILSSNWSCIDDVTPDNILILVWSTVTPSRILISLADAVTSEPFNCNLDVLISPLVPYITALLAVTIPGAAVLSLFNSAAEDNTLVELLPAPKWSSPALTTSIWELESVVTTLDAAAVPSVIPDKLETIFSVNSEEPSNILFALISA